MTLFEKIKSIYPSLTEADFCRPDGTIVLQNDGDGDYIAKWSHPDFPQPTQEQLDGVK